MGDLLNAVASFIKHGIDYEEAKLWIDAVEILNWIKMRHSVSTENSNFYGSHCTGANNNLIPIWLDNNIPLEIAQKLKMLDLRETESFFAAGGNRDHIIAIAGAREKHRQKLVSDFAFYQAHFDQMMLMLSSQLFQT